MEQVTMVILFAMFSLTVVTLAVFARPKTARIAMKVLERFVANMLNRLIP